MSVVTPRIELIGDRHHLWAGDVRDYLAQWMEEQS